MRSGLEGTPFELSKTVFGQFFGGVQMLPNVENKVKYHLGKQILNLGAKWNKKMGCRNFVIICGAFEDTL